METQIAPDVSKSWAARFTQEYPALGKTAAVMVAAFWQPIRVDCIVARLVVAAEGEGSLFVNGIRH